MARLLGNQREQAVGMLRARASQREVARHFNVHVYTISRLNRRFQETGATADRPRAPRPRVTTPQQDRYIRLRYLRDRFLPATVTAAQTPGRHNRRISDQTVRNRLREHGLQARRPYRCLPLTAARRRVRLDWARQHLNWNAIRWNSVLFTDESRFKLSVADGRTRVWCRRGERYADAKVLERDRWGGPSVMVWAGVSYRHKTLLLFIEGNLNAVRYRDEILTPTAVPFVLRHRLVFQQDNARPHSARVSQDYLRQNNVQVLDWPPFSPDLSPIEHLWDILDRRIRRRVPAPGSVRQLREALQEEWENIRQEEIRTLINSMHRRCQAVVDARGGHTRY